VLMILEQAVTKQTVAIHFLLNRLLFVWHILRKLRARVSLATPTFVPWRL
jgi:hypothetical protein